MLVIDLGVRTDGDRWDIDTSYGSRNTTRFKSLRTVYSITIGRLSWEIEDLVKTFSAECGSKDSDCEGLRFKMQPGSDKSDYLVAGKKSLPLAQLNKFNVVRGDNKWRSLVSGADSSGKPGFAVLLPRHFAEVTANGSALRTVPAPKRNTFVDEFINTVEKNHLYMDHSLQTSYTAAFYYLFQNAVQRKSLNVSATSLQQQLAFDGNRQEMNVQMSIPTTSAIVSLVGCFALLLMSVGILIRARQSERVLQERANAATVTEAMMNSTKFPPLLLQMALVQITDEDDDSAAVQDTRPQVPLQKLCVQSVILKHSEEMHKHSFHISSEIEV